MPFSRSAARDRASERERRRADRELRRVLSEPRSIQQVEHAADQPARAGAEPTHTGAALGEDEFAQLVRAALDDLPLFMRFELQGNIGATIAAQPARSSWRSVRCTAAAPGSANRPVAGAVRPPARAAPASAGALLGSVRSSCRVAVSASSGSIA